MAKKGFYKRQVMDRISGVCVVTLRGTDPREVVVCNCASCRLLLISRFAPGDVTGPRALHHVSGRPYCHGCHKAARERFIRRRDCQTSFQHPGGGPLPRMWSSDIHVDRRGQLREILRNLDGGNTIYRSRVDSPIGRAYGTVPEDDDV